MIINHLKNKVMSVLDWIFVIVLLAIIGAVAVSVWIVRKGKKGIGKLKERREERKAKK